jgi:hypothetical protein
MIPTLQQGQIGRTILLNHGDPNLLFLMKNTGSGGVIYDGSPYHSTITLSAGPPVVSSTVSKWGTHSTKLDWNGTNYCCFTAPNAGLNAMSQTEGLTIEAWIYGGTNSIYTSMLFGLDGTSQYIEIGNQGGTWYIVGDTQSVDIPFQTDTFYHNPGTGEVFSNSAWRHIAVVRPAGTATYPRVYFNGNYIGAFDVPWTPENGVQNYARIGQPRGGASSDYGIFYIEDFRIMKGEVYTGTGTYTIPTATFPEY